MRSRASSFPRSRWRSARTVAGGAVAPAGSMRLGHSPTLRPDPHPPARPRPPHLAASAYCRLAAANGVGLRPTRTFLSMRLPVMPPGKPMLAKAVYELPRDPRLLYEPKWDGFR